MDPFTRYLPTLEKTLQTHLTPRPEAPALVYGMMQYHMGWVDQNFTPQQINPGKRLRPIFLLLACEAQGGDWPMALPAAAAVELLHNFSLIHDDIEDRDTTRRGRPTLWTLWGEAQAINAGDALFSIAYQALINLPPALYKPAWERFSLTVLHLTEGQCRDIAFENASNVSETEYLQMIEGKTAALLALCCELGGLCAGAPPEKVAALAEFGHMLGLGFQMEDDLLGLWGEPTETGKPVGSDLIHHKKTLPILHGLAHSPALTELLAAPALDEATVARGLQLLEEAGSRAYTRARSAEYHRLAMAALERSAGSGEAQSALETLALRLLNRKM